MNATATPTLGDINMKSLLKYRVWSAALLIGVLAIVMHVGPAGPLASTTLATNVAAGVVGLGFWQTLGCIGCIAGFVVGAGTTVAGFAVFLAANPEIGILCVSTCVAAAT
jgi:hypothetical protein